MKMRGIAFALWLALLLAAEYVLLVPLNLTSVPFWGMVLVFGTLLLMIPAIPGRGSAKEREEGIPETEKVIGISRKRKAGHRGGSGLSYHSVKWIGNAFLFGIGGMFLLGLALLFCSPVFHAGNYATTIGEIETTTFEEARPQVDSVSDIALIDTATASRIGSRKLGSLEDVVSQFVDGEYTQITYKGRVKKTAAVDYDGLFKYLNNRGTGTPGYLIVDPIAGTAELIRMQNGIRYTPGAYFSQDIRRHLRMQYPALLFGETFFEIDEDGNPYWITQIQRHRLFLLNPENIGVVLTDAVTGQSQRFGLAEVPEWVDTVFDGDYVCEKYDNYGMLSGGFWNSIFGKKGCRISTKCEFEDEDGESYSVSDFGYVADEKDIWIYTGVTSATSADHSDIGMLMVNGRTGRVRYMTLAGADESSAMAAADGELQQYGYLASFPSIINVDGAPAYIMVMTDNNRIVKNYAMVNMQNYSQVVTGDTQNEVFRKYRRLVSGTETAGRDGEQEQVISDRKVRSAVYGSDPDGHYLELTFEDGASEKYYMTD